MNKRKYYAVLEVTEEKKIFNTNTSRDAYIINNKIKQGKCYYIDRVTGERLEDGYSFNRA